MDRNTACRLNINNGMPYGALTHLLGSVVARTMGDLGDVPAVRLALPPGGRPPRTAVSGKPLKRRQRPSLLRGC